MDKQIVISLKTIILVFLVGFCFYVLWRLGPIIGLVFISLLITISMEHTVRFFSKQTIFGKKFSRPIGVIISYLLVFLVLGLILSVGLDPVIAQLRKLFQTLSKVNTVITLGNSIGISTSELISGFVRTSGGVLSATQSIFSNVTTIFSIIILSIYLSLDWVNIKTRIGNLFPSPKREKLQFMFVEIENNVGLWLKGKLIVMLIVGTLGYIACVAVGVEYPLALGILSGLLEIVPILGPVMATVIAGTIAFLIDPVKGLIIVIIFTGIQQLEGNVLVPNIMQKVSGFSPVAILVALLVGGDLFGVVGAITAIPVMMIGAVAIKTYKNFNS